jgi:mycoredoxin
MTNQNNSQIIVYTSSWCGHALAVERFLNENNVPVTFVDIGKDTEAREELIALNNGFASVPTLVFPDGTKMTEPSLSALRSRLGLDSPSGGLIDRLRGALWA